MAPRACPVCGKELAKKVDPNEPYADFPFCSARCRLIDLGNWLGERYRVPGDPVDVERLPDEDA